LVLQSNPPASATSIDELLRVRADTTPGDLAVCFLLDGEEEGPRLSYAGLDARARALAALLRDVGEPGDRVLLLFEAGLEFVPAFFGCLYAGLVPVPLPPPRLDRLAQSWQGLANVAADCQPRIALTTSDLAPSLAQGFDRMSHGCPLRWIAVDQIDLGHARRWRQERIGPNSLALLQYTSGTTSAPKGVMVTHGNLMHNERMFQTALEHSGPGQGVSWLPLHHDMGLIGGLLQAIFHGAPVAMMSPLSLLQEPFRWLSAISRYRADTSGGPNFIYDLCVRRVTAEQKASLDLSNWSIAVISSEPVSARVMERFSEAFASCGFRPETFYPCYGLAEATVFVTGGSKSSRPTVRAIRTSPLEQGRAEEVSADDPDARLLVGCGRAWLGQRVEIVDPNSLQLCPPRSVGEIWVAGPSVAAGYWNRPDESARTFAARLSGSGEGPFLRTGDLGFMCEGELFVTGRLKEILVIRGRNYHPHDIEAVVQQAHPGLRGDRGAVFETGPDGEPRLVVAQELDRRYRDADLTKLAGDIRQAVAEQHHLQVHDVCFLQPGALPRTDSGKIQRHACRIAYERGTLRRWRKT
jgi:acyl-CoA synthetase (AMP-forming)/AMP-acid ligase II